MRKLEKGEKIKCLVNKCHFTKNKEYIVYDHDIDNKIINCYDNDDFVNELKENECEYNGQYTSIWGDW